MKTLTVVEAQKLLANANTPELLDALFKSLIKALEDHESKPDQSQTLTNLNIEVEDLKVKLKSALDEKKDAEDMANQALESVNLTLASIPKETTVLFEKKKYKVLFGVDGLTKEEIAQDKALIARLVKIKSGALELLEGN